MFFFAQTNQLKRQCKKYSKLSSNHIKSNNDIKNEERSENQYLNEELELPRSNKQLSNFKHNNLKNLKISLDQINNVRALRLIGFENFVNYVACEPHINIYLSHPALIKLTNEISSKHHIMFNYDTTFNIGPLFVTPLVARNIHFEKAPIYPVSFLLHERKFESSHLMYLQYLSSNLLNINNHNIYDRS